LCLEKSWKKAVRSVLDELRDIRAMHGNLLSLETLGIIGPRHFRICC
jgi:hypothetical protein